MLANSPVVLIAVFRNRVAFDRHDDFAQAEVVEVEVDLRAEFAGLRGFQRAYQVFGSAGGQLERDVALQTEAAIRASAERKADDFDPVPRGIGQAKADFVLTDRHGQ